jgi:organic radical activating enzyme
MPDDQPSSKDEFLHPRSRYYGEFTPSNLLFNANLQEFATQVGYICALETNGKISSAEAYGQIKQLFKSLKQSKKGLGIEKEDQDSGNV